MIASPTPRSVPDSPAWSAKVAPWFTSPKPRATSPRAATTPNCPNPEAKAATATPATARSFQRRNRNPPGPGTGTLPGSALNAACPVHDMSLRAPAAAGKGREARQDYADVRLGTFLPQILQGTSPPRQRAAGQIPPKRTGHVNEPRSRRCFLALPGNVTPDAAGSRACQASRHGRVPGQLSGFPGRPMACGRVVRVMTDDPAGCRAGLAELRGTSSGTALHFPGGRAYCLAEASPLKNIHGPGGTAGISLHAAALSMARGVSGVWLRAVCRLGLLCRGTVYLLVGYLALASHGRAGAPASSAGAVQAAGAWGRVPLVLLVAGLGAYALTQLIEAVFRPAHATGTMGAWRQRAVSPWGCLLYAAFCLSTARLAVQAQPAQTAQSEQRQDTGVTAELLRNRMGPRGPDPGGDPRRGRRGGDGPPVSPARLPGAVHYRGYAPGAGHPDQGARRGGLRRARRLVRAGRRLPAESRGAVQRETGQRAGRGLPFSGQLRLRPWLLAGLASGLLCYGLYCLLEARYRDLTPGR